MIFAYVLRILEIFTTLHSLNNMKMRHCNVFDDIYLIYTFGLLTRLLDISQVLFYVFLWIEMQDRDGIKVHKQNRTKSICLVNKIFITWHKERYFGGKQRLIRSRHDGVIQSRRRICIWLILPASHILKTVISVSEFNFEAFWLFHNAVVSFQSN